MYLHGLTDSQVEASRAKHGSNAIPESQPTTFWEAFKEAFGDSMIKILIVIAIIMGVMTALGYAEWFEPAGTVVAILIFAFVSAKTNVASDQAYRKTRASVKPDMIKVIRNCSVKEVPISDVVVNDIVVLQSGDKVPADGTVVSGNLKVDNAALNGEPEECKKMAADSADFPEKVTSETVVDKYHVFRGAVVTDGEAHVNIAKVGLATMMGRMAEEMQQEEPDSPLKVKLNVLADRISLFGKVGAVVIALCLMLFKVLSGGGLDYFSLPIGEILHDVANAVSLAIVIIVCAVPEGLPLMIALVLMQNSKKLLDHNVLVRKAVGIETAGSMNILFSDKTGTITKGKLEVSTFLLADGKETTLDDLSTSHVVTSIARSTQSMFDAAGNVVGGNVTDKALLKFIGSLRYEGAVNSGGSIECEQGFNSANKFSQVQIGGVTYYKGAPERLLAKATKYLDADGKVCDLDMDVLNSKIDELAERSMRVLAFGYSNSAMTTDAINDDVIISGLVGIRDDVRPDAKEAIKRIHNAGIQLVMITGDRLETARAIAKDAGLLTDADSVVISSAELNEMTDDQVKEILPRIRVIARALPTDKSRMVRLSQELNLVAGMTGDGVNDSPALKLADVGFAMGSGTDVAKEASKIVILDDSLTSIADAIWYGRTIYHNILKFCNFQLVINVCAVVISAISPFFGIEEPLKVTHLLFVNLVMDSLGALMLGNEPALQQYLTEKPRRRDESIISKAMMSRILLEAFWLIVISFFYLKAPAVVNAFATEEQHLTGYFVLFITCALFNGLNVRDNGFGIFNGLNENKNFVKIAVVIAAIQAAIVYIGAMHPWLNNISMMFSCTPISLVNYGLIIVLAATIVPFDLLRKAVLGRE